MNDQFDEEAARLEKTLVELAVIKVRVGLFKDVLAAALRQADAAAFARGVGEERKAAVL